MTGGGALLERAHADIGKRSAARISDNLFIVKALEAFASALSRGRLFIQRDSRQEICSEQRTFHKAYEEVTVLSRLGSPSVQAL